MLVIDHLRRKKENKRSMATSSGMSVSLFGLSSSLVRAMTMSEQ